MTAGSTALSERQETILALIIHEFIEHAEPVGSKRLVERYGLGVSSATVRNEMTVLTEAGYLRQPHTSAGRVPTEQGYRYFVRGLLGETDLPAEEKRLIRHQFHQAPVDMEEWVRLGGVGVVQTPRACAGQDASGVLAQAARFGVLGQEIARLVAEVLERADELSTGQLYRDGLSNVLAQPEFADSERGRSALHLLEEHSLLEEVLAKALSPSIGGVQVVIGGEGAWEELRDYSMVLARYGAAGYATGALAVLGPTRMAYGRSISAVRYVAGLMSNLVLEAFAA